MITFTHDTTRYTVKTPEKQALVEQYCTKITARTGRTKHKMDSFAKRYSSNPVYPKFMEGTSTAFYVREYERANAYRFGGLCMGTRREPSSLFDTLSTNPQFTQDDSHIEEVNYE
jgi:hypothetical protein